MSEIPSTMRALVLDGVGFEHVGVRIVATPKPGTQELLARVDAAGICTSLVKIIEQGGEHTLIHGWDVSRFPLILGDEGSITLVEVGKALQGRFHLGERYAIQPSVYHEPIHYRKRYRNGANGVDTIAVGYTLPGFLAEYIMIGEEILAGGNLLSLPDSSLPYAHVALSEPFSCVVSAQEHHLHIFQETPHAERRVSKGIKCAGVTIIIGAGAMGRMHIDLALAYRPRVIIVSDLISERLERARKLFRSRAKELGITLLLVNPNSSDLERMVSEVTHARGADDIIVAVGSPDAVEEAQKFSGRGTLLNIFGGLRKGNEKVRLDGNNIHYRETVVTGSSGGTLWDLSRALELMADGRIDPSAHITRIGDLDHVVSLIEEVKGCRLDGKAVVYPHRSSEEILTVDRWGGAEEAAFLGKGN